MTALRWIAAAAAVALVCLTQTPGGSAPQETEPASIQAVVERVRSDLLGEIPGLDARNAHFFLLVDVSGSAYDLSPVFHELYNFLVTHFLDEGDELTLIPFFHDPLPANLAAATMHCGRGDAKNVALARYDLKPVSRDEWGTDLLEPVYVALRYCREQSLFGQKFVVVIRLSDQAGTDQSEFRGGPPPFPPTEEERQEFEALLAALAARADGLPTAVVLNGAPYTVAGVDKPLHVAAWYSGDYEKLPVVPTSQLDRERGPWETEAMEAVLHRAWWDNRTLVIRWTEARDAETYVLYASNDKDALLGALRSRSVAPDVRRIEIPPGSAASVPDRRNVLELRYEDALDFAGSEVALTEPFWLGLHVVRAGEEDARSNERVRRVDPIPGGVSLWERAVRLAGQLVPVFVLITVVLYAFLPVVYHVVSIGDERWHVLCGGPGLPVRCISEDEDSAHDEKTMKVMASGESSPFIGQAVAVFHALPRWLPARLRSRLVIEPTPLASLRISGVPDETLRQGEKNEVLLTARDGSGATLFLALDVSNFWQRYWKKLTPVLVAAGLTVASGVVAVLGAVIR